MPEALSPEKRATDQKAWSSEVNWVLTKLRMPQVELARKLGVSEAIISRWRNPDPEKGCLPSKAGQILFYEFASRKGLYTQDSVDQLRRPQRGK
jgi:hypothetical protein